MNAITKKIKDAFSQGKTQVNITSNPGKNRIAINLVSLQFEVESYDSSLKEVFALADLIARNLGSEKGIDGFTYEERKQRAGIT